MGFLTNLNKISKELKGGWINGQMSASLKYTLFNAISITGNNANHGKNHEGENLYFDKLGTFIIVESANGETEKYKILEKIELKEELDQGLLFKTLKGSDIYSFNLKMDSFNTLNFVRISSSDPHWETYEGSLKQAFNSH
jgi:hypothetical protein